MFSCEQDSFWILEENQQDIMSQIKQGCKRVKGASVFAMENTA